MQFKSCIFAVNETRQRLWGGVPRRSLRTSLTGIFLLTFGFWLLPSWVARAGEYEACSQCSLLLRSGLGTGAAAKHANESASAPAQPARQRRRGNPPVVAPSFSEEERRGFKQRGFTNTFLSDGLNGTSNPLGGGTSGGGLESNGLRAISAQERGIVPVFDPTDVIIPRSGIR